MDKKKKQKFYKILTALREKALLSVKNSSLQGEVVQGDEIDISNSIMANAMNSQFSERAQTNLRQIDAAIRRINEGTFGLCSECEQDIGEARLLSQPMTLLCVSCKEEQEREASAYSRLKR